jgi:hypothetical protein
MPTFYSSKVRNRLRADAWVVNLKDRSAYFYELGLRMAERLADEELTSLLQTVLALRYRQIMDSAFNSVGEDTTELTQKLTALELKMFLEGARAAAGLSAWHARRHLKTTASDIVKAAARRREK